MITVIAIGIGAIATIRWFRRLRATEDHGAGTLKDVSQATGVVLKIADAVLAILDVLLNVTRARPTQIVQPPRPLGMQYAAEAPD